MQKSIYLFISIIILFSSCRKSNYFLDEQSAIISDEGNGTGTTTWTNDKTYLLKGLVFVNEGQTLTIEPGTIIRAKTGQAEDASALIVARGGKIIAEGLPDQPIIFTTEGDDLQGSVPYNSKGLWGGVIILGSAPLNTERNEDHIEGISISEPRGVYGGTNITDNSGIFKYVSIRHAGTNLGLNNEINGLTLGGVGNGTTIEHVEVFGSADDGIEFFGGSVNCKYLVAAFCEDDAFDIDIGYRGNLQFLLGIQEPGYGDHLLEITGGTYQTNFDELTQPIIYNSTFIGNSAAGAIAYFNAGASGSVYYSVFINKSTGILLEKTEFTYNSYQNFLDGYLQIFDNIFYNVADNDSSKILGSTVSDNNEEETLAQKFSSFKNAVKSTGITGIENEKAFMPDITLEINQPIYPSDWFDNFEYHGAFKSINWTNGWTLFYEFLNTSDQKK